MNAENILLFNNWTAQADAAPMNSVDPATTVSADTDMGVPVNAVDDYEEDVAV